MRSLVSYRFSDLNFKELILTALNGPVLEQINPKTVQFAKYYMCVAILLVVVAVILKVVRLQWRPPMCFRDWIRRIVRGVPNVLGLMAAIFEAILSIFSW